MQAAATQAQQRLSAPELDGFWIHLDVDVLDSQAMPAVDSPQPGGLSFSELSELLKVVVGSRRAAGLQLTIFDPALDHDGSRAKALVDAVAAGFKV